MESRLGSRRGDGRVDRGKRDWSDRNSWYTFSLVNQTFPPLKAPSLLPPLPSIQVSSSSESISLHYYSGPASAFPTPSFWKSFDLLWTLNKGVCELNSDDTVQPIHDAITQVASKSGVDARIIFTVILQKSNCLLSAATTNNGVNNSELMQSHNEVCYTNKASILQMIRDGIEGTF